MECPPQNPEFRNNPENFPPCINVFIFCKRGSHIPCLVCFDALPPSQQFFSYVEMISCLPGLNPIGAASANSSKFRGVDHGCTSSIYFDNAGDNMRMTL